jgi:putative spermidine/putrescine transport system permease protein
MTTDSIARALSWTMLGLVLLFLALPFLMIVPISFSASSVIAFPPQGFSLRWYANVRNADAILSALGLSAQIAFLATCISLVIGTLCSIAIVRGYIAGGRAIATLMVSPLMVPGLVLGIAFLQAAREFGLRDAYATLLLAHVVVTLPFIMRTVLASLSLFDFTMIDAARMLGLSYPMALWKVLVPNILPGFMSGALFAFVASFDNYPVSIFLVDVRTKTLPIQLLNQLEMSPDPTLAAVSTILVGLTVLALIVCDRLVGLRRMAAI